MKAIRIIPFRALSRRGALLALCLALTPAMAAGQAQNERPPANKGPHERPAEATEAIDRLKSPYCPGLMLEVCPSPGGAALRDTVEMLAAEGLDADSIVEWVLGRYGREWLALPPARGSSLVAWLVPPLAVILGVLAVVVVLRKIRRPREGPPPEEVSEEERARLAAAIRALEAEEEMNF